MPGRGLLVTATDTGVGKTVLTAGLCGALAARGLAMGVFKPLQSGNALDDPDGDAATLVRLGGLAATPGEICCAAFEAPLAPAVAAAREGRSVALGPVLERAGELAAACELLLVEGAGGLLVPMGEDWTVADLAVALGHPVLVVARAGLGTVNHTALTVEALRARGLDVAGVVLNATQEPDPSWADNPALIERLADVAVLGSVLRIDLARLGRSPPRSRRTSTSTPCSRRSGTCMSEAWEAWLAGEAPGAHPGAPRDRAVDGPWAERDGRRLLNLSSNDYFGLAGHPALREAAARAARARAARVPARRASSSARTARTRRSRRSSPRSRGTERALVVDRASSRTRARSRRCSTATARSSPTG
ncbi:MAG: dethiobiotin synthase [Thermoleophilia bacterium]